MTTPNLPGYARLDDGSFYHRQEQNGHEVIHLARFTIPTYEGFYDLIERAVSRAESGRVRPGGLEEQLLHPPGAQAICDPRDSAENLIDYLGDMYPERDPEPIHTLRLARGLIPEPLDSLLEGSGLHAEGIPSDTGLYAALFDPQLQALGYGHTWMAFPLCDRRAAVQPWEVECIHDRDGHVVDTSRRPEYESQVYAVLDRIEPVVTDARRLAPFPDVTRGVMDAHLIRIAREILESDERGDAV